MVYSGLCKGAYLACSSDSFDRLDLFFESRLARTYPITCQDSRGILLCNGSHMVCLPRQGCTVYVGPGKHVITSLAFFQRVSMQVATQPDAHMRWHATISSSKHIVNFEACAFPTFGTIHTHHVATEYTHMTVMKRASSMGLERV